MLTFFRIVDTQTPLSSTPAPLHARELGCLRALLQRASITIDPDRGEVDGTAFNFEANANAIALAHLPDMLASRLDILAIFEEAQFLGRSVRVSRSQPNTDATLEVSEHIALSPEIAVTSEQADRVLECLQIDPQCSNRLPLATLRARLGNPATYHRFERDHLTTTYEYLERLSYTDCGEQHPQFSWA